jgi:ATP-binding protein involved in chromosome partitioning
MDRPEPLAEPAVRLALAEIRYPGLNRDIVSFGMVRAVEVRDGSVRVELTLSSTRPEVPRLLQTAIEGKLGGLGATAVEVEFLAPERRGVGMEDPWADRGRLPGVRRIVAVGSGKGGVGKSTVAVNLALALRLEGLRVGLMDADIHGPSVPIILGIEDGARRVRMTEDRKVIPLEVHGLWVVSFGFFLGPRSPAIWRGPKVSKAVRQFSRGTVWPDLDVLIVDLPPGTGDIPLSLAQSVVIDGGIVVTTPQRLAVEEAGKAVEMYRTLEVPVLGVVENMSYSECECGRRSYPFGRGGGSALATVSGVPLLGEIPFEPSAVADEDSGSPPLLEHPESGLSEAIRTIASRVTAGLGFTKVESAEAAP